MALVDDLDMFRDLVKSRLERVAPAALQSFYRYFLDAEPVWTGDLVFNYTFSIGSPAAATYTGRQLGDIGPRIDRAGAISEARAMYQDQIPENVPIGQDLWITNNMNYAKRIEQQGSPYGYGQGVLQAACNAWPQHVKLGVAQVTS